MLRKNRNLSIADVAQKINVSQSTLKRWEKNDSLTDYVYIQALARVYGVSVKDVMGNDWQEFVGGTPLTEQAGQSQFAGTSVRRNLGIILKVLAITLAVYGFLYITALAFLPYNFSQVVYNGVKKFIAYPEIAIAIALSLAPLVACATAICHKKST